MPISAVGMPYSHFKTYDINTNFILEYHDGYFYDDTLQYIETDEYDTNTGLYFKDMVYTIVIGG